MNISSEKNLKIKNLLKLQKKSSLRIKKNVIIVEGSREIEKALQGNYLPKELFLCKCRKIYQENVISENFPIVTEISRNIFGKIAYRKGSGGVIGIFHRKKLNLEDLNVSKRPFLLILEDIEKPGNIGAILRSAKAVSVEGIILCHFKTDIFHPNVIRASLGTIFTQNIITANIIELLSWLRERRIQLIVSTLKKNAINLYNSNLCSGIALVMGSESSGISEEIMKVADTFLQIPMYGNIDSLNVSNATAIILFEALRQRMEFNKNHNRISL